MFCNLQAINLAKKKDDEDYKRKMKVMTPKGEA